MSPMDETKRQTNLARHGVDFAEMARFQWDSAVSEPDNRLDYGEAHEIRLGLIGDRVYDVAYTRRGGSYARKLVTV